MNQRNVVIIHFNDPTSGMGVYAELLKSCYSHDWNVEVSSYVSSRGIFVETFKVLFDQNHSVIALLKQKLDHNPPPVIHFSDTPLYFPIIMRICKKYNVETIVTIHDPIPHPGKKFRDRVKGNILSLRNKLIYTLSRNQKRTHIHLHSRKQGPQVNALNILYAPHPTVPRQGDYDRITTYDPKSSPLKVSYLGRIEYYKGVDIFYDAINLLMKDDLAQVQFTIAGRGNIAGLKELKGLVINNKFLTQDEFEELIINSHVIVLPYRTATQSGVLNYALALNKPVIISDVGLMPDYVDADKTGVIISDLTPQKLATEIQNIANNPAVVESMSRNAYYFKEKYSSARIGEIYSTYLDNQ